jgi:hypothetical protein
MISIAAGKVLGQLHVRFFRREIIFFSSFAFQDAGMMDTAREEEAYVRGWSLQGVFVTNNGHPSGMAQGGEVYLLFLGLLLVSCVG